MVIGHTNSQGFVEADTIEALGPGVSLPPLEPSQMEASHTEETQESPSVPDVNGNQQPEQLGNMTYEFQGVVEAMSGNIWKINGQSVNVEFAENNNPVNIGEIVEFEGYYSVDSQFIVTKIEVKSSGLFDNIQLDGSEKGGSDNKSGGNDNGGGGSSNDDNHGDNHDD